jgi:hypothetical protein
VAERIRYGITQLVQPEIIILMFLLGEAQGVQSALYLHTEQQTAPGQQMGGYGQGG